MYILRPNFGTFKRFCLKSVSIIDAFTCFEFVLSQAPRQRTDTHFEARVSFPCFTTPTERIKGFVNAFEDRNLKVLRHFTEIVIFLTGDLQQLFLVNRETKRPSAQRSEVHTSGLTTFLKFFLLPVLDTQDT